MNKVIIIGIILLSLMSWFTSFTLNKYNFFKTERSKVFAGIIHFWIVLIVTILLFKRYYTKIDPFMYVFSLYSCDATSSLSFALEVDDYYTYSDTTTVKPCLKTLHGGLVFCWNGTVHYILCIVAIALYTSSQSHREMSLYWAGSLMNSMIVILPVCLTGTSVINASTLLYILYAVLSFVVIMYYLDRRPYQCRIFYKHMSIWQRKVDFLFLLYFLAAIVIAIIRGLAVLDVQTSWLQNYVDVYEPYLKDTSQFPKFQAFTYEYLFVVYYLAAAYGLISPGQFWMADWSLIHAGAAAQAQFTYIFGSILQLTSKENYPPKTGIFTFVFWAVNLTLLVVPPLFAWWCHQNPNHYGQTYTEDLAIPYSMQATKYSKRTE